MANGDSGSGAFPGIRGLLSTIAQNVALKKLQESSPLFRLQVATAKENLATSQQEREQSQAEFETAQEQAPLTRELTELQIDREEQFQRGETQRQRIEQEEAERQATMAPLNRDLAEARANLIDAQRSGVQKDVEQADEILRLKEREVKVAEKNAESTARGVMTPADRDRLKAITTSHRNLSDPDSKGADARSLGSAKVLSNAERVQQLTELRELFKPLFNDPSGIGQPEDKEMLQLLQQVSGGDTSGLNEEGLKKYKYYQPYFEYYQAVQGRADIGASQPGVSDDFKIRTGAAFRAVVILNSLSDAEWGTYINEVDRGEFPPHVILDLMSQGRDAKAAAKAKAAQQ